MNMPSRFSIATYWAKREPKFVIDLGEPSCFACHYFQEHWDEPNTMQERWNKARLERAHIVADSIGGSVDVENFVLLDRQCHREAPMTNSRELFLQWVHNRESWLSRCFRDWTLAFQRAGITEAALSKIDFRDYTNFQKRFSEHLRRCRFDKHPQLLGLPGDGDTVALILKDFLTVQAG